MNKHRINKYKRQYRKRKHQKMLLYEKAYRDSHRQQVRKTAKKHNDKRNKMIRLNILTHYGGKCSCCGETAQEFLTLQHKGGWGNKHRKQVGVGGVYYDLHKRGYPKRGLTLNCMNCNWATRFGKPCPHKKYE